MRVLILSCWYPTAEDQTMGIFVHEHAKAMAAAGIDVQVLHFYTSASGELYRREAYREIRDGITVYHVVIHSRFHKAMLLRRNHFGRHLSSVMDDILDEFDPQIIHAHVVFQAGIVARRLSRAFEIPYAITEHWSGLDWFSRAWHMPTRAARRAYRDAAGVSAVSPYLAGLMKRHLGVSREIEITPNVVDTDLFRPGDAVRSGINGRKPGEPIRLLCITSFGKGKKVTKRPDVLLDALALMPEKERQKYAITIAGSGEALDDFNLQIRKQGLEKQVKTTGFAPKEMIAEWMRDADALVHPSEVETFGLVVAEALCSGLPCIVSEKGALPDMIRPGYNGLLVVENTAKEWLNALRAIEPILETTDRRKISGEMAGRYSYFAAGTMWAEWLEHCSRKSVTEQ